MVDSKVSFCVIAPEGMPSFSHCFPPIPTLPALCLLCCTSTVPIDLVLRSHKRSLFRTEFDRLFSCSVWHFILAQTPVLCVPLRVDRHILKRRPTRGVEQQKVRRSRLRDGCPSSATQAVHCHE